VKSARLMLGYVRHNLMSAMAYRGAFILQVVGMILNDVVLLFFWWILFTRIPTLRGWSMVEVMMLYALVAFAFGVANIVCGNAFFVARAVARGELDYYLALPADPLLHFLVSRMSLSAWGDLLFGLLVFLVVDPQRWLHLPLFLLLGACAALIFVAFAVLVGSLAFWVGNAENLAAQAIHALLNFSLYPVEIFPWAVQLLLYTLVPAALIGSMPVELVVHFHLGRLGVLLAVTAGLVLAARLVFALGLRRYESGNLVVARG
jgi:ABC-2 type transport system permease protein